MLYQGWIEVSCDHLQGVPQALASDTDLVEQRPGVVVTVSEGREVGKPLADQRLSEAAEAGLRLLLPADSGNHADLELLEVPRRTVVGSLLQGRLRLCAMSQSPAGEHVERREVRRGGSVNRRGQRLQEHIPVACPSNGFSQRSQNGPQLCADGLRQAVAEEVDRRCCSPGSHPQGVDVLPTAARLAERFSQAVADLREPLVNHPTGSLSDWRRCGRAGDRAALGLLPHDVAFCRLLCGARALDAPILLRGEDGRRGSPAVWPCRPRAIRGRGCGSCCRESQPPPPG